MLQSTGHIAINLVELIQPQTSETKHLICMSICLVLFSRSVMPTVGCSSKEDPHLIALKNVTVDVRVYHLKL